MDLYGLIGFSDILYVKKCVYLFVIFARAPTPGKMLRWMIGYSSGSLNILI